MTDVERFEGGGLSGGDGAHQGVVVIGMLSRGGLQRSDLQGFLGPLHTVTAAIFSDNFSIWSSCFGCFFALCFYEDTLILQRHFKDDDVREATNEHKCHK
jgi:hypothetical protein